MEMALDAVKCLEEASLPGPFRKGLKRSAVDLDDEANSDDDFLNTSAQPAVVVPTSRGKNMALVRKAARAVSPTVSGYSSSSSSSADFSKPSEEKWIAMIEEEFRKREEFNLQMDDKMGNITKKIRGIDDHISRVKGEKKSLRAHREALREHIRLLDEQIRVLDAQELTLDKKERSASERKKDIRRSLQNFIKLIGNNAY
ncbi:hypothetical protein NQ315_014922 [Exocentrus adspersus]|uniref:Uncharacterized protein n=1 Tax=Exocentrus adspersus TaxID=1586481 RepID=A0AAV8VAZ8_9CUCU|nr:hypothetical protein NQ315_014922 [Exocentrus adspersus]